MKHENEVQKRSTIELSYLSLLCTVLSWYNHLFLSKSLKRNMSLPLELQYQQASNVILLSIMEFRKKLQMLRSGHEQLNPSKGLRQRWTRWQ
jgi:hypothetical protein